MLKLLPPQLQIGLAIVLAALVITAGAIVYGRIYDRGYQAAVVVAEAEKAKIKAANEKAIADARRGLERQLSDLLFKNKQVETNVEKLDVEADQDPLALRGGISADSVRRIDAVR
ncbi:MAG: hypothetical protein DI537_13685 [Stutzerimonas stutzeri]|nr:MAG: hypothetical protein DI537_13685 [Stutzerimonas stutzeri]